MGETRETFTFMIHLLWKNVHVHAHARYPPVHASTSAHCSAQHVATPTIMLNFHEENFCDQKSNHEIHKNIVPWKFGAIRYCIATWQLLHGGRIMGIGPKYPTFGTRYLCEYLRVPCTEMLPWSTWTLPGYGMCMRIRRRVALSCGLCLES